MAIEVLLRNARTLAFLGEAAEYQALSWIRRDIEEGEFSLTINRNLIPDNFTRKNTLVHIRRDGLDEFFGIIRNRQLQQPESGRAEEEWLLTGPDLKWFLGGRIIDPDPDEHDSQIGVAAETAMRHYVDAHLLARADLREELEVDFKNMATDPPLGMEVEYNARYDNLLKALQDLALAGEVCHEVLLDHEGYVYMVNGYRASSVVFTIHDVKHLTYEERTQGIVNSVYVLGGGEGIARNVAVVTDENSIAENFRREVAVDYRQASLESTLAQRGRNEILRTDQESLTVAFEPLGLPVAGAPYAYRQDWDLCDQVTVSIPSLGVTVERMIVEVEVAADAKEQELVRVALGSPSPRLNRALAIALEKTKPAQYV